MNMYFDLIFQLGITEWQAIGKKTHIVAVHCQL